MGLDGVLMQLRELAPALPVLVNRRDTLWKRVATAARASPNVSKSGNVLAIYNVILDYYTCKLQYAAGQSTPCGS